MKNQLILVTWDDAWQDQENFATLHGITQTHAPLPVQTMGWLLIDDATGISLANEQSSADGKTTYRGRSFIPRAMITSVTLFGMQKRKRPGAGIVALPQAQ